MGAIPNTDSFWARCKIQVTSRIMGVVHCPIGVVGTAVHAVGFILISALGGLFFERSRGWAKLEAKRVIWCSGISVNRLKTIIYVSKELKFKLRNLKTAILWPSEQYMKDIGGAATPWREVLGDIQALVKLIFTGVKAVAKLCFGAAKRITAAVAGVAGTVVHTVALIAMTVLGLGGAFSKTYRRAWVLEAKRIEWCAGAIFLGLWTGLSPKNTVPVSDATSSPYLARLRAAFWPSYQELYSNIPINYQDLPQTPPQSPTSSVQPEIVDVPADDLGYSSSED